MIIIKNQKGFTLAEVLITLVIIGVIAAMTIPTLINNTQKQEFVSGLKKAYSTLNQSLIKIAELHDASPGDYSFAKTNGYGLGNDFPKVANVTKKYNRSDEIMSGYTYTTLKRDDVTPGVSSGYPAFITADGQIFVFQKTFGPSGREGISNEDKNNSSHIIYVDVNGLKKPNKMGRDLFVFYLIDDKGIIPAGAESYATSVVGPGPACDDLAVYGTTCTGRVLKENAMNY